jgi:hypothetical protein
VIQAFSYLRSVGQRKEVKWELPYYPAWRSILNLYSATESRIKGGRVNMSKRISTALLAGLIVVSFLLASGASAAESGGTLDDCLYMSIGSVYGMPGEDIMIPIYISETTGWGVMAAEMTICWCDTPTGLLQYLGCEGGEVSINSGWYMGECGICGPNCISVAAAGATPLVGSGVLFYLKFHVSANAKPCMCCELWFTEIKLYDPEDPLNVCHRNGEFCVPWCDIYGEVVHWWC